MPIADRPVNRSPAGEGSVSASSAVGQRRPGRDEELKLQDITSSGMCCFIGKPISLGKNIFGYNV